ncbi:hypothetical protein AXG93_2369s1050 [Marchantia polymorpha subsp. ruderalis]|uniref:Uncharacterized protein n=1 Tax=Marchantia polymorpha subsp. ruderalis TaxID=1480154 RepID=A0A176W8H2_MARPO|nr:hypothetical protein AXG93_2369s1050 [Marchantia polymorpha subsp. ruderalis]
MAKSIPLRMMPLRVPQVGLQAFQDELTAVKLDLLLWGWNWVCLAMVREWLREKYQPPRGYRPHPERWRVSDWEQVLGRCAGEEGDLLIDSESVHLSKEEEATFSALFKNRKSSKNEYKIRDYVDQKRRNVAVAILQILQPHRTTYMSSWQVGFVELALAAEEKIQFSLLSRTNPGRLVRDVDVDTDPDEVPAITPPARLRAEEEPREAWAPQKRKFDGEAELSRRELLAVPVRSRAINEQARPKQKARKLILPVGSSADTVRAAIARDSPSSDEDVSTEVLGRSSDLPAPKAPVPSEEALRLSGHRGRRAATARMPAQERCLPLEQVPFDDTPSEQEQFRVVPSAEVASALKPPESIPTGEGSDAKTRMPLAATALAVPDWEDVVGPPRAGSPTPLGVLALHGVEAVAEEAARPSARESPRISAATKILETEEDTPSEEEEVQSVRGTPTGVLCEQVVLLLRYLDRKATKYGDPHQCEYYVELVRNWTRIKMATNLELMVLNQKYRQLDERYNFLKDQCALARKLQKAALKLRDEMMTNARGKIDELRAKIQTDFNVEQIQIRNLADELVRKT